MISQRVLPSFILLVLLIFSMDIIAQQSKLDSLFQQRPELDGLEYALITRKIAHELVTINIDSAEYFVTELEEYISRDYDKLLDAYILKLKGYIAEQNFEYEKSMEYRRESFALFKELRDYNEMGWNARGLGILFYNLGNYANATEYFILSLSAFETDGNKKGIADIYNMLGAVNYVTGHSARALEYYNSSLELFDEIGEESKQNKVYNNIGIILYEEEKYTEALKYYEDALEGFLASDNEEGICGAYGNMSLCYFEIGQIDKAFEYIHSSRKLAVKNKKIIDEIAAYVNLGSYHRVAMNLDSAGFYLDQALHMSKENEIKPLLEEAYEELSILYEVREDFKKAYNYHIKYFEVRDEIHQEDSEVRIEKLMTSYEQRLRQQEFDLLTTEQKTRSMINKVFGALISVTVGLLFIMVFGYKNNKKKNILLEEKNIELIESNEKLIASEEALRKVIDDKNKLFTIIAHDLRNPVAAVSGFSELLYDNFDQLDSKTQKDYVSQVIQGSTRTYELLENLLLWARSQMDSIVVKKTESNVRKLIDDSLVSIQSHLQGKEIEIEITVECDEFVYADYEMMKAVLRNLITNAAKFSFPGGKVEVRCNTVDDMFKIAVIDQGIGIEAETVEGLLLQKGGSTTPGTSGETGSGLGLMICKDYTERNGGSINVKSTPGKGSIFTVTLPLKTHTT